VSLLPYFIISIPFAVGNHVLAGRLGYNQVLCGVLSLIPLVNLFVWVWILYSVLIRLFDYLKVIAEKVEAPITT
jgi:hypothetical protein